MKRFSKYMIAASLPLACIALPVDAVSAQVNASQDTQDLQNALRRIARNSNDSSALADAGLAALSLGDTRAAIGFLAKADQLYPRSGRVKAGLGRALLLEKNPFGAIRYFDQAVSNGIAVQKIAGDRGLAYDLIGRNADAQRDYELALRTDSSDQLLSRYAISLGISGNVDGADAKLNPLLQKSNRDAWRNRAFILAMNGKTKDANAIARQTMQKQMAKAIKPFFDRMPKLTPAQKAAAVHFGHFPASENIGVDVASVQYAANSVARGGSGADAGLIPLGEPLGSEAVKPRVLAMPDQSPRRRPGAGNASKRSKKPIEYVVVEDGARSRSGRRGKKNTRRVAANSPEGLRILRRAARDGSADAKAFLDDQKKAAAADAASQTAQTAKADTTPPEIPKSKPKPPVKLAAANVKPPTPEFKAPTPGFKTNVKLPAVSVAKKPTETKIAALETNKPAAAPANAAQLPPRQSQVFVDKPLVSASVERKVGIGIIPPRAQNRTPKPEPKIAKPVPQPIEQKKQPVELASFDLAKSLPPAKAPIAKPVQIAQVQPQRKQLSDIIGSISIPDAEKKATVVPVDLEKITPATAKPKPVAKKEEPKKPEPRKVEEKHPKRYWVQIATGSNLSALKYDYRRMSKKSGDLFKGKNGWTSPWGRTRRLVVGPFDDFKAAKKFEAGFRKNGGDGFAWSSAKGTEVNKLP